MATYLVTSVGQTIAVGGDGAPKTYGAAVPVQSIPLGVATGHVPDRITGMLGQGIGRIHGTVKLKGEPANTPLRRKVWLLRQRDGIKIRETLSDEATGEYEFRYIDELQLWTVISFDHTGDKRAVIADGLVPELIALP